MPVQRTLDPQRPVLLARQAIVDREGDPFGFELLYRSLRTSTPVDRWSVGAQDRATRTVIGAALRCGLTPLCGELPAFVNATRSLLLGRMPLPPLPVQMGIEVVESVVGDPEVVEGVERLRAAGHLIAVDDFSAHPNQLPLLPHADLVKIDLRDLVHQGPELLEQARRHGARTIAERVETPEDYAWCRSLGFDLFQGYLWERPVVLDVAALQRTR